MDFEDILKEVGEFGRYQKRLFYIFLVPIITVMPFMTISTIFQIAAPDHWCHVPQLTNLSFEEQHRLIRPLDSLTNKLSSCLMYDIDYDEVLKSGNESTYYRNVSSLSTKPCENGWLFDNIYYDETAVTKHNLICDRNHIPSMILSIGGIGGVVGTPVFGWIADRIGRRKAFYMTVFTFIFSTISPNFIRELHTYIVFRVIGGLVFPSIFQIPYIVVVEMIAPQVRSKIVGFIGLTWTSELQYLKNISYICFAAGLCLVPLVAYLTRHWVYLNMVCSVFGVLFLFYWKMVPESPRWLIENKRYKEASEIMAEIAKVNKKPIPLNLEEKLKLVGKKTDAEKEVEPQAPFMEFVRRPHLRCIFLLVTFNFIANTVAYNGLLYNIYNFHGNEFINFFLLAVIEFPSYLLAWYLIETRLGRRWSNTFFCILCSVALCLPAFLPTEWKNVTNAATLVGKFGIAASFMVIYQQAPELFPTPLRSQGLAFCSTISGIINFGIPYLALLGAYGVWLPLFIISTISAIAAIEASFLPETLNENLPQTIVEGENFGKGNKYWRFAK